MKKYVLTVSRTFLKTHKRAEQQTNFIYKILKSQNLLIDNFEYEPKLHTIRGNYELWSKRIKEVQEGTAVLCIRYWSGKPYNSKQVEFCVLDKDSGVGVQKLEFVNNIFHICIDGKWNCCDVKDLAKNDGLSFDDFCEWFKGYDLTDPMAIIHFTKFRY